MEFIFLKTIWNIETSVLQIGKQSLWEVLRIFLVNTVNQYQSWNSSPSCYIKRKPYLYHFKILVDFDNVPLI